MELSIIVCCYNEEKNIARCLRSLINQKTHFEYEIIVVDDCSTDNSSKIVNNFSQKIRYIKNPENYGIGKTANIGIKNANGRFITRVDGDDYVSTHFVEILLVSMLETDYDAVYCDYLVVNDNEKIIGKGNSEFNPIACGIIFKFDKLISIGIYNSKLRVEEDKDLRVRFMKKFNSLHIPLPLYRYRAHSNNTTGKKIVLKHLDNKR